MTDDAVPTADELAGIAGMFGALRPDELQECCAELAYRETGEVPADAAIAAAIDDARDAYHLVGMDGVLLPGPAAFPQLPPFAEDLPHLVDVEERDVDRTAAGERVREAIAEELEAGVDPERAAELAQLCYDLEAWADVDAGALRERCSAASE